jgi:hypothetical protein
MLCVCILMLYYSYQTCVDECWSATMASCLLREKMNVYIGTCMNECIHRHMHEWLQYAHAWMHQQFAPWLYALLILACVCTCTYVYRYAECSSAPQRALQLSVVTPSHTHVFTHQTYMYIHRYIRMYMHSFTWMRLRIPLRQSGAPSSHTNIHSYTNTHRRIHAYMHSFTWMRLQIPLRQSGAPSSPTSWSPINDSRLGQAAKPVSLCQ